MAGYTVGSQSHSGKGNLNSAKKHLVFGREPGASDENLAPDRTLTAAL